MNLNRGTLRIFGTWKVFPVKRKEIFLYQKSLIKMVFDSTELNNNLKIDLIKKINSKKITDSNQI